jgi:DNA repair exonuclease SbcCD ATPase subunit
MKTSKIVIRNLFGIAERTLDGHSVELAGPKGTGKTSVLDAIRYALTNRSDRDYIIRQGADEGEILIETDTGLSINRKTRTNAADSVKVRDGSLTHTRPAEFLNQIFTPLQLNPVEFTQMSRQEKNRVILNLVEFAWDTNWIAEKFGEIPKGVDYSKHILEVLADIQSENGVYYQSRQNINRDIRNNQALIAEIAKDIPENYDAAKWESYSLGERYGELDRLKENNSIIERARSFKAAY